LTVSIEEALRRGLGARFHFYAERLRTYWLNTTFYGEYQWADDDFIIDEDVMTCWATLEHSFLSVQKLRLNLEVLSQIKGPTMLPRFLARGQLLSLEVQLTQKPVPRDVITALCGVCTSIEELFIVGNHYQLESEHISDMLLYATGLRAVRMNMGVSYTHLTYLAMNRYLTRLEISCSNVDALTGMGNVPPLPKGLHALRELIVTDHTSTALLVPALLHACANPSLVVCELYLDRAHSTLLSILQSLAHHIHLRCLSIKGAHRYNGEVPSAQMSLILNGLRELEFLHLPHCITPRLTEDLLTQTVQSHPQLRDWEMGDEPNTLEPMPFTSRYSILPLASFIALLEACPYLRQLPVVVSMQDTTSVGRSVLVTAEYTGPLRLIDVQDLEDAKQLVRELFPRVTSLYVHHPKGSEHVWSQIWPDVPIKKRRR
jgi:hypothetical protein